MPEETLQAWSRVLFRTAYRGRRLRNHRCPSLYRENGVLLLLPLTLVLVLLLVLLLVLNVLEPVRKLCCLEPGPRLLRLRRYGDDFMNKRACLLLRHNGVGRRGGRGGGTRSRGVIS